MSIMISQNIRSLRKGMGLTQEQLAEAVGVTVGAVSKWESGMSNPDIELIVELADFFSTSVDVLLGYEWRNLNMGQMVERIRQFCYSKDYETGPKEIEKALQKYPNCFDIVYRSAVLYDMKGLEQQHKPSLQRALELYRKSLEFMSQNTDDEVSEVSIQNRIGNIYMALGETDKSIAHLQKNNICGINNSQIGFYLALQKRTEEALTYLSNSLLVSFSDMIMTGVGLSNCYSDTKEYDKAVDCIGFMLSYLKGLRRPKKISYLDKIECVLNVALANIYEDKGEHERAVEYLNKAHSLAILYDSAPSYSCKDIKFYTGKDFPIIDDLGESAAESISKALVENYQSCSKLISYYEELTGTKLPVPGRID